MDRHEEDEEADNERRQGAFRILVGWVLSALRALHPYLDTMRDIHTALFYFFGRYLEFSKTLCNVQYLYLQKNRGQVGYQVTNIRVLGLFVRPLCFKISALTTLSARFWGSFLGLS